MYGFIYLVVWITLLCRILAEDQNRYDFGRYPQIFVFGAQKAGTTSLVDLLVQNKHICRDGMKEKHFFDGVGDWNSLQRRKAFLSYFQKCSPDKIGFDGTPMSHNTAVPGRIVASFSKREFQSKKFILVLREPVSRDFSYFEHRLRACGDFLMKPDEIKDKQNSNFFHESCVIVIPFFDARLSHALAPMTFREYYKSGKMNVQDSHYAEHIKNFLKHIPRDQIFIVNMERVIYETADTMARIAQFLEITDTWEDDVELPHDNDSSHMSALLDCTTYDELHAHYQRANAGLVALINDHVKRPPSEPQFLPFENTRAKCFPVHSRVPTPIIRKHITGPDLFLIGTFGDPIATYLKTIVTRNIAFCSRGDPDKRFFNNDQMWSKGLSAYVNMFQGCEGPGSTGGAQATLDSTPMFMDGAVPDRLRAALGPDALRKKKFVLVLRDPVVHEYIMFETFLHNCKRLSQGQGQSRGDEASTRAKCSIVSNSKADTFAKYVDSVDGFQADGYSMHLRNWLRVLRRDQLFIINADAFEKDPSPTVQQLQMFLGLATPLVSVVGEVAIPSVKAKLGDLRCDLLQMVVTSFKKQNDGLLKLINDPGKPLWQPTFSPFAQNVTSCSPHAMTAPRAPT